MIGPMASRLAREVAAHRRAEEGLWNGACAESLARDLQVAARDTEAAAEAREEAREGSRKMDELISLVGEEEALARVDHYRRW